MLTLNQTKVHSVWKLLCSDMTFSKNKYFCYCHLKSNKHITRKIYLVLLSIKFLFNFRENVYLNTSKLQCLTLPLIKLTSAMSDLDL